METKLLVKDAKIILGRDIRSKAYYTKNQALALTTAPLSKLLFWCLECDSNNSVATVTPRDILVIRNHFNLFKKELELSKENANQPMGKMEMQHTVLVPDEFEMKSFSNVKIERVARQIINLINVCMDTDGSAMKNFVLNKEYNLIDESIVVVEKTIDVFLGSGKFDKASGEWDTGADVETMPELGTLIPDNDMDTAKVMEPSADPSATGYVRTGMPNA